MFSLIATFGGSEMSDQNMYDLMKIPSVFATVKLE